MHRILIYKDTTASFDVDAQKGFTFLCPNELPVCDGHTIVDELNRQSLFAKVRICSKDAHPATPIWAAGDGKEQFTPVKGKSVDIRWNLHCVVGTTGHELLDGLPHPLDYNFVAQKGIEPDLHPYGACYHDIEETQTTGVIEFLKSRDIHTVIVGGLATDYCVKTTAIQLKKAGFRVIVNIGSCKGISPESISAAISEMDDIDIIVVESTEHLVLETK